MGITQNYMTLSYNADDGLVVEKDALISNGLFTLAFVPYNAFDQNVELEVKITQNFNSDLLKDHSLSLRFFDALTGDTVYLFTGTFSKDEDDTSSIVAKMLVSEEFSDVVLEFNNSAVVGGLSSTHAYNAVNTMDRLSIKMQLPTLDYEATDLCDVIVNQDYPANVMYLYFDGLNLDSFIAAQRAANKLNVRFWVEFPPELSIDQVIDFSNNLAPNDMHIAFLYSPIVARPSGATGLKGRKVPRAIGGALLSRYVLRNANVNSNGVPPIHRPIAGFDYPFSLPGITQAPGIVLDDTARKRLADARINVLQRLVTTNGIRFIIGDVITTYNDNNSLLGLVNASEISMFIDNTVIEIVKRHLLKPTEDTIGDSFKAVTKFLGYCTTQERQLLKKSSELGGQYFSLVIVPNNSRPHDAVDVELGYHTEGATRAAYMRTTVTAA